MSTIKLTREQLYERVWTTPLVQLAQEFSITDVAIAKTCKRLNVPTPPRGYWARLAAGQQPRKSPLPKAPIVEQRQGLAAETAKQLHSANPPTEVLAIQKLERIELPADHRGLHPVARELRTALLAATPGQDGKLHINDRIDVPSVSVSKKAVDGVARSFHVILSELETRGVEFRKFRGKYLFGRFKALCKSGVPGLTQCLALARFRCEREISQRRSGRRFRHPRYERS